jgi:hypothetical protein
MIRLNENVAINVKNRSFSATAHIKLADDGGEGVILAQGGRTGGWAFFLTEGKLAYHYNFCGLERTTVLADAPMAAGEHQVRVEFAYAGGGIGRGGDVTLFIDGESAGTGSVARTHPLYFSFDEGLDLGMDTGMPVYEGYHAHRGVFSGTIAWAEIELGLDDHNHLIDPEEQLAAAMRHQ